MPHLGRCGPPSQRRTSSSTDTVDNWVLSFTNLRCRQSVPPAGSVAMWRGRNRTKATKLFTVIGLLLL
ncbi:unnamed protein product [Toxocara canis]|uniref:Uncharacterized protein n=1 Tax=Toxocara canis TaxID=6265 RepID=A0A183U4S4_TOXCA|nr:unnamed protein product [Toxocara canis]